MSSTPTRSWTRARSPASSAACSKNYNYLRNPDLDRLTMTTTQASCHGRRRSVRSWDVQPSALAFGLQDMHGDQPWTRRSSDVIRDCASGCYFRTAGWGTRNTDFRSSDPHHQPSHQLQFAEHALVRAAKVEECWNCVVLHGINIYINIMHVYVFFWMHVYLNSCTFQCSRISQLRNDLTVPVYFVALL